MNEPFVIWEDTDDTRAVGLGPVGSVVWEQRTRDAMRQIAWTKLTLDNIEYCRRARKAIDELIRDPHNAAVEVLETGHVVTVRNHRAVLGIYEEDDAGFFDHEFVVEHNSPDALGQPSWRKVPLTPPGPVVGTLNTLMWTLARGRPEETK